MSSYVTRKTPGNTDWFVHDRFGMFIHFGLYAMPARHEWIKSMEKIPDSKYDLDSTERRNIEHGLTHLCEAWLDPSLQWKSTLKSVEDYEEVFRTKGYQKKTIDEITSIKDKVMDNLENDTTRT